jgi:type I restriction-modification system DNA methylase subunit
MAKAAKTETRFEETLWDSANKLRGKVESSEYKHVVLGLIFLKFASDKLEKIAQISAGGDKPQSFSADETTEYNVPIFSNTTIDEGLYGYTYK